MAPKPTRPRRRPARPAAPPSSAAVRRRTEAAPLLIAQPSASPWVVRRADGRERVIRYLDPCREEPVEERAHRFRLWRRHTAAA